MPIDIQPPRAHREPPVWNWGEWDKVERVKGAIRSLEQGYFEQGASLCDAMTRDERVAGAMLTRTEALPSLPLTFEAGRGPQAAEVARRFEEERLFARLCPDSALIQLASWANMVGIGLAENVWSVELAPDGTRWEWVPKLKVWHPRWLTWDEEQQVLMLQTRDGQVPVQPGNGQWVVLTPLGFERCWMHGLVRSLYIPWLVRQWGWRDWARHSEVLGTPIKKASVPSNAEKGEAMEFIRSVAGVGAESVVKLPKRGGDPNDQFDLELIEAKASDGQGFDKLITKASDAITIRILGQNLSTEVKGGSFAAAQVHAQVRGDVLQADAEALAPVLRDHVFRWWCFYNYGTPDAAPTPVWNTDPPADKLQEAQASKTLGEALAALRATGAQVDVDALLERADIPITGPWKEPPAPKPEPQQFKPGAARAGGQTALASQAAEGAATPVEAQAQEYIDALAGKLSGPATEAVSGMVASLLSAVTSATDYSDLEKRVGAAFPQLHDNDLVTLQQNAFLLAELVGRWAATEDTGAGDVDTEGDA